MRHTGRRALAPVALATALVAAVTGLTTTSAGAATPAPWPAGGYVPTTCSSQQSLSGGQTRYRDTTAPTVGPVTFARGATQVAVRPGGTRASFVARLTDLCSGVDGAVLDQYRNGRYLREWQLQPVASDGRAFDVVGRSGATTLQVHEIGRYTFRGGVSRQRYSSFVLNSSHQLVSRVGQEKWSLVTNPAQTLLVLKATRLVDVSRKALGSGRFRLAADVQVATDQAWVGLGGARVRLERRTGPGSWTRVRSLSASGSGSVSAVVRVTARTVFRFELTQATKRLRAGSTSRPLRVG